MKVEITDTGWKEITTTKIILGKEFKNFMEDMSVILWVKTNKKLNLNKGIRNHCSCCHEPWLKLSGNTHLFPSNKGNKLICDSCCEKLKVS